MLAALMKPAGMLWDGLGRSSQGLRPTAGNMENLSSTIHKELNPANHYVNLQADLSPVEPLDENPFLVNTLVVALWRIQLICSQTSDLQNWEIISVCCCKQLSWLFYCYGAVDHQYNSKM